MKLTKTWAGASITLMAAVSTLSPGAAGAQAPKAFAFPGAPPAPARPVDHPYGPPISLEQAHLVAAAAEAEAGRLKVEATIAITDPAGQIVYYARATGAAYNAEEMAVKKARASARNRRPSSYDAARYAAGMTALTAAAEIFPFGGGQPIVSNGRVIGAIGATGGSDDEVAIAGAAAIR